MILVNFREAWSSAKAQETLDTELKHAMALTEPEETLGTELKHAIVLNLRNQKLWVFFSPHIHPAYKHLPTGSR